MFASDIVTFPLIDDPPIHLDPQPLFQTNTWQYWNSLIF